MRFWLYLSILWGAAANAQTTETPYEGFFHQPLSDEDANALLLAFERRVFITPMVGESGVYFDFGLHYRSMPSIASSEFVSGFAGTVPVVPLPSLGVEFVSERQRVFFNFLYVPQIKISTAPISFGMQWATFGQDLLLAQAGKPGRGLLFGYRFSYSAGQMSRQFVVEEPTKLADWSSTSIATEFTAGWRLSSTDLTYHVGTGSTSNKGTEVDTYNDISLSPANTSQYFAFGITFCFRDETLCLANEFHSDNHSLFTWGGSLMVRK